MAGLGDGICVFTIKFQVQVTIQAQEGRRKIPANQQEVYLDYKF